MPNQYLRESAETVIEAAVAYGDVLMVDEVRKGRDSALFRTAC